MNETTKKAPEVTIYGNVGADPETRSIPAKTVAKPVYDPVTDQVVTREFEKPSRTLRTFSLAVNAKGAAGEPITRWIRCEDWRNVSAAVRKGDRLRLRGYFVTRTYEKDGEPKDVRAFVVKALHVERSKSNSESPAE